MGAPRDADVRIHPPQSVSDALTASVRSLQRTPLPARPVVARLDTILTGFFVFMRFPQANARPSAVLIDEFDAGVFQCATNGQIVR